VGYYAQALRGHWQMLREARPVSDWLQDPATPATLAERLRASQAIRDFAVRELHLPDNPSYRRYAELGRKAAVWNVVAAPEFSLELKQWCYPVMGCATYRGFYAAEDAQAYARELAAQGWEVKVYPVPAYSTLGWVSPQRWGGYFADPLTNVILGDSDLYLAKLMFHELAHQVAFAPGDTEFNESYATAVERLGLQRWLQGRSAQAPVQTAPQPASQAAAQAPDQSLPSGEAWQRLLRQEAQRSDFQALVMRTRAELAALYATAQGAEAKRAAKANILSGMRRSHQELVQGPWQGERGYEAWFASANNAALGSVASYQLQVPAFECLFEKSGRDFARFHQAVQRLAALPPEARRQGLPAQEALGQSSGQACAPAAENTVSVATQNRAWPADENVGRH
jgi:predicted aminopeptidase